MHVHIHFTHMGLLVSHLGLHSSNSASMLLADSTDTRHSSLKCKLVKEYFKFCLIWHKYNIDNQQKYIPSDVLSFNYSINAADKLVSDFSNLSSQCR